MNYPLIPSYLLMILLCFFFHNGDSSAAELKNDLAKISHWVTQWKMSFNPDPSKQAQEVIFSRNVNTLAANDEYSRSNWENLPLPIQMQISEKPKRCCIFIAFLKTTLNFENFEKNEPPSLSI